MTDELKVKVRAMETKNRELVLVDLKGNQANPAMIKTIAKVVADVEAAPEATAVAISVSWVEPANPKSSDMP
mgnify:CR=1 FL=1